MWKAYISDQAPVNGFLQILDKEVMQEAREKEEGN